MEGAGQEVGDLNRRETGAEWERQAARYLESQGVRIMESNFRSRQGEIDLIGCHQGCLVFIEVKYRRSGCRGHALDAVDYRKQRRICQVADYYRYCHGIGDDADVRYDVVGIQGDEVQWIQNAFPHIYTREIR